MAIFSTLQATQNITGPPRKRNDRPKGGFEFKTYADYAASFGSSAIPKEKWRGQDGAWLELDRRLCRGTWIQAVHTITRLKLIEIGKPGDSNYEPSRLQPYGQILSYYWLVNVWVEGRAHETRWIKGAFSLVEDLWEAYEDDIDSGNKCDFLSAPAVATILSELNKEIANYAITQFYRLQYGEYMLDPLRGFDAYEFDRNFVIEEQRDVAFEIYDFYRGTTALAVMSDIFNNTHSWSKIRTSILNILKNLDPSGIKIPVFSGKGYYESDLTNSLYRYGQDARIQVPMAMLWPHHYFINDPVFDDDSFPTTTIPDINFYRQKFRETLKVGIKREPGKGKYDIVRMGEEYVSQTLNMEALVFQTYQKANEAIMVIFD